MTVAALKPPEDVPEMVRSLARDPEESYVGVHRHVTKQGVQIDVQVTSCPMRVAGRPCWLAIGNDITKTRQLEEQPRQSQKLDAIGQLAGGIAHDFNNVLVAILAGAELALDDIGADHPAHAELMEVLSAAHRAKALTRQLLAFSRIQNLKPRVLDLNTLVTQLAKMLERLLGEDIRLSLCLSRSPCAIEADPGHLEQVVLNLVVNARDAIRAPRRESRCSASTRWVPRC